MINVSVEKVGPTRSFLSLFRRSLMVKVQHKLMIIVIISIIVKEKQLMLTGIVKQEMELRRTLRTAALRIMAGCETVVAAGGDCRQRFLCLSSLYRLLFGQVLSQLQWQLWLKCDSGL